MSRENVEVVQANLEAWNAGDMDALRDKYDPDAMIVRGLEGWPESDPLLGRDAVMGYFEQLRESWDADTFEAISDFVDIGDRVVVRLLWRGAGRGPDMSVEFTIIYTLRDGRVFYQEHFWEHADALRSVGLSELDASADTSWRPGPRAVAKRDKR
jgi:ketosteroid isomerase-like protein